MRIKQSRLIISFAILFLLPAIVFLGGCETNGPDNYENVHWESIVGPELSFDYINYDDSFGTLTYNGETIEIYFGWFDNETAFCVYSPNYIEFVNTIGVDDEIPWTTYFGGDFKDFDRNNLTITLIVKYDSLFNNEYTEIHLQGTRITE